MGVAKIDISTKFSDHPGFIVVSLRVRIDLLAVKQAALHFSYKCVLEEIAAKKMSRELGTQNVSL